MILSRSRPSLQCATSFDLSLTESIAFACPKADLVAKADLVEALG
ncbi:hypothetical protein SynBIOSU31_01332 [Synechococcus sp. BIOS-U3-1]|nr:hypothetical protein SynBIOSU31_01332 [Synechococcus sp. BIOS-U3-1]